MFLRLLFISALVFCLAPGADAAVTRAGTPVECTDSAAGDTTFSCTMTIGSLSNGLLLCGVMSNNNVDINPSVAWDSAGVNEALTMVTSSEHSATRYGSLWYLKNPTAGASKLITVTSASGAARDGMICATYEGVDQTTPTDCTGCTSSGNADVVSNVSTSNTSSTITSGTGEILFGCQSKANAATVTWDTGSGNDPIHDQSVGTGGHACADDDDGADDTLNNSWAGSSSNVIISVNINAAAGGGGGGGGTGGLLLLGVGK